MVQILLTVKGQTSSDGTLDPMLPHVGDVIASVDDTAAWGNAELSNPDWRILIFPGVAATQVDDLLTRARGSTAYRGFTLDLTAASIPAGLAAYLADNTRAAPTFTYTGNFQSFRSWIKPRT